MPKVMHHAPTMSIDISVLKGLPPHSVWCELPVMASRLDLVLKISSCANACTAGGRETILDILQPLMVEPELHKLAFHVSVVCLAFTPSLFDAALDSTLTLHAVVNTEISAAEG